MSFVQQILLGSWFVCTVANHTVLANWAEISFMSTVVTESGKTLTGVVIEGYDENEESPLQPNLSLTEWRKFMGFLQSHTVPWIKKQLTEQYEGIIPADFFADIAKNINYERPHTSTIMVSAGTTLDQPLAHLVIQPPDAKGSLPLDRFKIPPKLTRKCQREPEVVSLGDLVGQNLLNDYVTLPGDCWDYVKAKVFYETREFANWVIDPQELVPSHEVAKFLFALASRSRGFGARPTEDSAANQELMKSRTVEDNDKAPLPLATMPGAIIAHVCDHEVFQTLFSWLGLEKLNLGPDSKHLPEKTTFVGADFETFKQQIPGFCRRKDEKDFWSIRHWSVYRPDFHLNDTAQKLIASLFPKKISVSKVFDKESIPKNLTFRPISEAEYGKISGAELDCGFSFRAELFTFFPEHKNMIAKSHFHDAIDSVKGSLFPTVKLKSLWFGKLRPLGHENQFLNEVIEVFNHKAGYQRNYETFDLRLYPATMQSPCVDLGESYCYQARLRVHQQSLNKNRDRIPVIAEILDTSGAWVNHRCVATPKFIAILKENSVEKREF